MTKGVAQLNLSGAWGGLEMSTLKIARHFQQRGLRSFVVTGFGTPLAQAAQEAGITTLELDGGDHFSPRVSWQLRRFLKAQQIEMVMVHQLRNLWILRPALWGLPQIRVVGFARMFLKGIRKTDWLHRHLYLRLEKMVTLSALQKQALLPCLPVPADRYTVIPNGVDCERFHPRHRSGDIRRRDFKVLGEEKVIGVIGRLDQQKGQMEFIEAAAKILPKHPSTRFVVVGTESVGEPGFAQRLKARVQELGIASQVEFLGHRTDTPALAASFDIFVLASYEENFGNVVLEAMASGQAIIATNSGGTPEQIQDGEWGLLVPPRSAEALALAMDKYLVDTDLAKAHAQRAREIAETQFPVAKIMTEIEQLL